MMDTVTTAMNYGLGALAIVSMLMIFKLVFNDMRHMFMKLINEISELRKSIDALREEILRRK